MTHKVAGALVQRGLPYVAALNTNSAGPPEIGTRLSCLGVKEPPDPGSEYLSASFFRARYRSELPSGVTVAPPPTSSFASFALSAPVTMGCAVSSPRDCFRIRQWPSR